MFFNRPNRKSKYVKAKTPEKLKKQKAAIVSYYINKRECNSKSSTTKK